MEDELPKIILMACTLIVITLLMAKLLSFIFLYFLMFLAVMVQ